MTRRGSEGRDAGPRTGRIALVALWTLVLLMTGAAAGLGVWLHHARPEPMAQPQSIALPPAPEAVPPRAEALAAANAAQAEAAALLRAGRMDTAPPPPPAVPTRHAPAGEAPNEEAPRDSDRSDSAGASQPNASQQGMPEANAEDPPAADTASAPPPEAPVPDPALDSTQDAAVPPAEEDASEAGASALSPGENLPAWRRYARAPADTESSQPRIAVVLTGLGYSDSASETAIEQLPGAIGLSFSPYARRSAEWAAIARLAGREVLVDLPMEPQSYPADDPGPRALMTSASTQENLDRLDWMLEQVPGAIGVTAMLGSRFATTAEALEPVMAGLAARGLLYLDNGVRGSLATKVAARMGAPYAAAMLTVDGAQVSREAIEARLVELERIARDRGFAVALANPYPVTVEVLQTWAAELDERGFTLMPLSALATPGTPGGLPAANTLGSSAAGMETNAAPAGAS